MDLVGVGCGAGSLSGNKSLAGDFLPLGKWVLAFLGPRNDCQGRLGAGLPTAIWSSQEETMDPRGTAAAPEWGGQSWTQRWWFFSSSHLPPGALLSSCHLSASCQLGSQSLGRGKYPQVPSFMWPLSPPLRCPKDNAVSFLPPSLSRQELWVLPDCLMVVRSGLRNICYGPTWCSCNLVYFHSYNHWSVRHRQLLKLMITFVRPRDCLVVSQPSTSRILSPFQGEDPGPKYGAHKLISTHPGFWSPGLCYRNWLPLPPTPQFWGHYPSFPQGTSHLHLSHPVFLAFTARDNHCGISLLGAWLLERENNWVLVWQLLGADTGFLFPQALSSTGHSANVCWRIRHKWPVPGRVTEWPPCENTPTPFGLKISQSINKFYSVPLVPGGFPCRRSWVWGCAMWWRLSGMQH